MADPVIEQLDALEKAAKDAGSDDVVNAVTKLKTEYKGSKDSKQKEAVAKAIPDITKGVLSAVTAFKEGDAIGGTAAILDILAGASAALGPEGALVGALFSMISMILSFFEPKQPSLVDQIKEFMINLEGVKEKDQLKSVADIVAVYVGACAGLIKEPPGKTDPQHNGVRDPGTLTDLVKSLNVLQGPVPMTVWGAQHWLQEPEYEDADAWSVVLNLHCEVYGRLREAITRQYLYAYDKDRTTKYIDKGNGDWTTRERDWKKLQHELHAKFLIMVQSDVHTSDFLTNIVPSARKHGLYVMRWDISGTKGQISVATGPKAFKENKVWGLGDGYMGMSIIPPREGVTHANGPYDAFLVRSVSSGNSIIRRKLDTLKRTWGEAELIQLATEGSGWLDCWTSPVSDAANKFEVFAASSYGGTGSLVTGLIWDSAAKTINTQGWPPQTRFNDMASQVRVAKPAAPSPDDPDKDAFDGSPIYYAVHGGDGSGFNKQIWAAALGGLHNVPVSMNGCYGIAADPHFLWMYGHDGFVCASHASVLSCLKGKLPVPRWLGNGQPRTIGGHVLALSSCEDGTLFALAAGNQAKTAPYHVDFKNGPYPAGWLVIDEDWETIPGGGGIECQKLPIFGWPRVGALATLLSKQQQAK